MARNLDDWDLPVLPVYAFSVVRRQSVVNLPII